MKKSQIVGWVLLVLAFLGLFDSDTYTSASGLGGIGTLAFFGLMLAAGFWDSGKKE